MNQLDRQCEATSLEDIVEKALQDLGVSYYTQHPTRTGFVLDFVVPQSKQIIAIEADGPCHDTKIARRRDAFRTKLLKQEGYKIVRIHHSQIQNTKQIIEEVLNEHAEIQCADCGNKAAVDAPNPN